MRSFLFSLSVGVFCSGAAIAAPINVADPGNPFEAFHFRDVIGPNSVGFGVGDFLSFGLTNVTPNGKGEGGAPGAPPTTAIATQNGTSLELFFNGDSVDPNRFSRGVDYDPSLTGAWTVELTNGPDSLTVQLPEVGDAEVVDRVSGVSLSQQSGATTPTLSWTNREIADQISIRVFDLLKRDPNGNADVVFDAGLPNDATSYTIPNGVLEEDGLYSIRIATARERTSGTGPSGQSLSGGFLTTGSTFFEFATSELPTNENVYLPEVDQVGGSPVFNFDNPVLAGLIEYYDPIVAIGYDYAIGEGNPNFASFILPSLGDDFFDLYLFDESLSAYVFETVVAAEDQYDFGGAGVSRFRILGIETDEGLDPNDPTAFVTGLAFVSDGQFTGTMTPITAEVEPIPLPASAFLLLGGIGLMGWQSRKRSN